MPGVMAGRRISRLRHKNINGRKRGIAQEFNGDPTERKISKLDFLSVGIPSCPDGSPS